MPAMSVDRIGYGAGERDVAGHAERAARARRARRRRPAPARERVTVIEFEIDDMNPQLYGALMDGLLAAGAHDVYYTPVQMKKNRPGTLVTVVAAAGAARAPRRRCVFRETTTLGLRYHDVLRECLEREIVTGRRRRGRRPDQAGPARRRRGRTRRRNSTTAPRSRASTASPSRTSMRPP